MQMTLSIEHIAAIHDALNEFAGLACSMPSTAEERIACSQALTYQAIALEQLSSQTGLQGFTYTLQVLCRGLQVASRNGLSDSDFENLTIWAMSSAAYLEAQLDDANIGDPIDQLTHVSAMPTIQGAMREMIRERLVSDCANLKNALSVPQELAHSEFSNDASVNEDAFAISNDASVLDDALAISQTDNLVFADEDTSANDAAFSIGEHIELETVLASQETLVQAETHAFAADFMLGDEPESATTQTEFTVEAEPVELLQLSEDTSASAVNSDAIWISPEELELVNQAIAEQLLPIAFELAAATDIEHQKTQAQNYLDSWQLISSAFDAIGLHPMQPFIEDANSMLTGLVEGSTNAEHVRLLTDLPVVLTGYLADPNNNTSIDDLLQLFSDPDWPENQGQVNTELLAFSLSKVSVGYDPSLLAQRKTLAEPADIELKIADDVMPAVLDGMLRELPVRCTEFNQMVNTIVRTGQPEAIDIARRIAHTLKGDGSIVGVRGIAVLTHSLEEILLSLSKKPGVPVPELADVLLESADCLEAMSDHLLGRGAPPENALDVLQKVLNWDSALYGANPVEAIISGPIELAEAFEPLTNIENTSTAESITAAPGVSAGPGASINVPTALLDQLLRMAGEAIIYSRQIENRANRLEQRVVDIARDNENLFGLVTELQQTVEVRSTGAGLGRNVMGNELDALEMEQYNELHTITTRLVEAATDSRATGGDIGQELGALKDLLLNQDRVHLDLQEKMLATLSVPAAGMVPRFQRIARQAARKLGKEIDIIIRGENTPIDNEVLDQLAEPMAHLLRNAVDHGLETNDEREFAGKSTLGQLRIEFAREGSQVLVSVADDGRGLDHQAIFERAIERGIVDRNAELSQDEIARLIFRSGFSTKDETSEISGRGIGMDIVLRAINRMKGTLSIHSELGKGTQFDIRLPISQVVANIILVRSQLGWLAVSLQGVERLLSLSPDDLINTEQGATVLINDEPVQAQHIENTYGMAAPAARMAQASLPALLVKNSLGIRKVIFVEQLSDSRTVIVKSLGPNLPPMPGIRGGTILGDGSVAPVVDLAELVGQSESLGYIEQAHVTASSLPSAVVVDDSLSVRRSMQQLLSDSGYEVRTARDGLEAVELLRERAPDILLVDLEMPRMNGLELTAFARNFDATRNTPVIMITSRTTERHKELANEAGVDHVLTKPYQDDELLDLIQHYMSVKV
jgi:chemotaxis protein histidine kinase CheA